MGQPKQKEASAQSTAWPKLSICIITFNRAKYLKKTLAHLSFLKTLPFDCEVLVSDNCSTDETAAVVAGFLKKFDRIRYIKQTRNVGPEGNFVSVFRSALGEFVLYLADDDMLIPEAVVSTVRYMEENPTVVACHAPWELWDDVSKQSSGLFYRIDEETVFQKKDSVDLFNFIIQNHIFPEIAVYRSDALHKILYLPHKAFGSFVNLARLLDCGDIVFLPNPFYRGVTVHWEGDTRVNYGYRQGMLEWDLYRGGVEYLFHKAFRNLGHLAVPEDQRDIGRKMIDGFIVTRLSIALRHLIVNKDFIGANDVFFRLLSCGAIPSAEVSNYSQFLAPKAAVQSVIETFEAITGLDCIGLYRVGDSNAVTVSIKELRQDLPVNQLSDDTINKITGKDKDKMLVLVGSDTEREKLIKADFRNGLVIVEGEVLSQFMP
jgi:glycosyltransferase involved in cell wall biosynthesis